MRYIKDKMRRFGAAALVAGSFAMLSANVAALEAKPQAAPFVLSRADGEEAQPAELVPLTATSAPELPDVDNERVDYWVKRFTSDQRTSFETYLDRMTSFAPLIESKLDERGMPHDLLYLAMIESGFNPVATSPANAKGLWQFIAATAERYGLTVNHKVDDRVDPARSTDAALSYLSDLYDRFGSWYLAAAAYNTGENRVARVMRDVTGSERGSEEDFFAISALLPKETRDYVPRLVAAARIANAPEKYGFTEGQS
jgi:membrane-bound lytic murein transglycosylase D